MFCRLFLVRDSSSVANSFVLTMFAKSVPKNFQIMPVREDTSLLHHYYTHSVLYEHTHTHTTLLITHCDSLLYYYYSTTDLSLSQEVKCL